ncbi:MAG: cytochrome c biogenesis protein ResB [Elusimicrobiota bacterium]
MRPNTAWNRFVSALSSLKLTLACLALLMALTVICTLAQVPLGTQAAVDRTIRTFLVWWRPEGSSLQIPVFPGGGMVGVLLFVNLALAQFMKLEWSRRKLGLWIAHLGLALLFLGEFSTAFFQVESHMPIEIGQTRDYTEDYHRLELAVTDTTDAQHDSTTAIPESIVKARGEIAHPSLPFRLRVQRYHENSQFYMRGPTDPPSEATLGVGASLHMRPEPPVSGEGQQNAAAALVSAVAADGRDLGSLWLSNALGAPQGFILEGRAFQLALRSRRYYLPFSLTLKEFHHDKYAGTNIPKNFSSLVRLNDAGGGEDRDALISMNNPLRYGGKAFYQASFGKNDTLSVFQVIQNPGWLIPYLSCILITLGMLIHFGLKLAGAMGGSK